MSLYKSIRYEIMDSDGFGYWVRDIDVESIEIVYVENNNGVGPFVEKGEAISIHGAKTIRAIGEALIAKANDFEKSGFSA